MSSIKEQTLNGMTAVIKQKCSLWNSLLRALGACAVHNFPTGLRFALYLLGPSFFIVDSWDVLVKQESKEVETYDDLGAEATGKAGSCLTEFLTIISQCGGAVAYLVFIGQNLVSIFRSQTVVTFSSFVFLLSLEVALSMIQMLSALAPFSAFADVCNLLAMAIIVKEDLQLFHGFEKVTPVTSARALSFVEGVTVLCFEGFGMTLALEGSMRDRRQYKVVLLTASVGITIVYLGFGFFGYLAYAEETRDINTPNLPDDWSSFAVKIGLCTALAFTFPTMMHPIHETIEGKLK